jgi:hypothetical protein
MPLPVWAGYVAVTAVAAGVGGAVTWYAQRGDGGWEEVGADIAQGAIDAGLPILDTLAEEAGTALLTVIRGIGGAVVDGVDFAYDAIREKLRGKEPDVIAALTIGFGVVFGLVYIYHSFKEANDAFRQGGLQIN